MEKKGLIFLTESQLINIEGMKGNKKPLHHHSKHCCRQDSPMDAKMNKQSLRRTRIT